MTLKERIIEELKKEDYLSDRELTDKILGVGAPQQSINQACRQLTVKGIIKRTNPPIKNYISARKLNIENYVNSKINPPIIDTHLHEEDIKKIFNDYLQQNGWETRVAWGKLHGIDIEAFRGNERWVIEVKGCGSRNPMRVNYFLAILGETFQRMDDENTHYSIALPDTQQFRNLWNRLPKLAKQRTGIDAIFVSTDSKIEFVK